MDGGTHGPSDFGLNFAPLEPTLSLPVLNPVPTKLSGTGLYQDIATRTLATGVKAYQPQFEVWIDGATMKRWVYLPPGTKIDTSNMDRWQFPLGTKLWQEFTRGGKLVETRMLWKRAQQTPVDLGWQAWAYVWDDAEADASLIEIAVSNVRGTGHNVSSPTECLRCHLTKFERPVGFSAIQLSGTGTGLRIKDLVDQGMLTDPPPSSDGYIIPGNATEVAALGYLHSNCGTCHAVDAPLFAGINQSLRLEVAKLAAVNTTPTYLTTYKKLTTSGRDKNKIRLDPMATATSSIYFRMGVCGIATLQMPPVATSVVDTTGQAAIGSWINIVP